MDLEELISVETEIHYIQIFGIFQNKYISAPISFRTKYKKISIRNIIFFFFALSLKRLKIRMSMAYSDSSLIRCNELSIRLYTLLLHRH